MNTTYHDPGYLFTAKGHAKTIKIYKHPETKRYVLLVYYNADLDQHSTYFSNKFTYASYDLAKRDAERIAR